MNIHVLTTAEAAWNQIGDRREWGSPFIWNNMNPSPISKFGGDITIHSSILCRELVWNCGDAELSVVFWMVSKIFKCTNRNPSRGRGTSQWLQGAGAGVAKTSRERGWWGGRCRRESSSSARGWGQRWKPEGELPGEPSCQVWSIVGPEEPLTEHKARLNVWLYPTHSWRWCWNLETVAAVNLHICGPDPAHSLPLLQRPLAMVKAATLCKQSNVMPSARAWLWIAHQLKFPGKG